MNQETKAFALKAAAQVAFVTAGAVGAGVAVGCAADGAGQSVDDLAGASTDCVRAIEGEADGEGVAASEADGGAGKAAPSKDAACDADATTTALSCKEKLAATFPNGDPNWWSGRHDWLDDGGVVDVSVTDPTLAACCEELARPKSDAGPWQDLDGLNAVRESGCCKVNGWGQGSSCTPWGPPMPPAMPGARRRALSPVRAEAVA